MRARVVIMLVALAAGGGVAALLGDAGPSAATIAHCQRARVGRHSVCLGVGRRCVHRYEHIYRQHGFTCSSRNRLRALNRGTGPPGTTGQSSSTSTSASTTFTTTSTTTTSTTTTSTTTSGFSCPTEPGVTRENDCPPPDPANPPADFCATHECIANWSNGRGTAVQCNDDEWSRSGGIQGACSYHRGESNNPPGPPPTY
jgi:hypothetical protein